LQSHNPGWDFSELDAYDDAYVRAVADHLGWIYASAQRKLRDWRARRQQPTGSRPSP
jgi:protein tyrosine/serine phosphatase